MYINYTRHTPKTLGNSCSKQMEYLTKEDIDLEPSQFFNSEREDISLNEAVNMIDGNRGANKLSEANYYMLNVSPSPNELRHLHNLADEVVNMRSFATEADRAIAHDLTMKLYMQQYVHVVMENYAENFDRNITADDLVYVAKIEKNRNYKEQDKDVRHNENITKQILSNPSDRTELEKLYKRNSQGKVIVKGMQKEGLNYHAHIVVSRYEKNGKPKEKHSFSPYAKAKRSKGLHNSTVGFNRDAMSEKIQNRFDILFNYERPEFEKYQYLKREYKTQNRTLEHTVSNTIKNNTKNLLKEAGIIPQQEIPTSLKELQGKVTNDLLKQLNVKEIKTVAKVIKNPKQVVIEKAIKLIKTGSQGLDLGL